MSQREVLYGCGCRAGGDAIPTFCPEHGDRVVGEGDERRAVARRSLAWSVLRELERFQEAQANLLMAVFQAKKDGIIDSAQGALLCGPPLYPLIDSIKGLAEDISGYDLDLEHHGITRRAYRDKT